MNDTQHNDTAKDELLPCPSCGGPATKGIGSHATVDHPILWVVECNKRCLSTIYRMDAVEVWNKRHEAAHRWTRVDDSLPERDFETRVNQWYPVTVEYFDPDNPTAPELEVLILDYWFDDRGWRNVPEGGRVTAWREPDLPYHHWCGKSVDTVALPEITEPAAKPDTSDIDAAAGAYLAIHEPGEDALAMMSGFAVQEICRAFEELDQKVFRSHGKTSPLYRLAMTQIMEEKLNIKL